MSTAGIYNAHPTIINGTEQYLHNQMKSHQAPFYFGGSQVLINLHPEPHHHMSGNGFMVSGSGIPGAYNRRSVVPREAQNVYNNDFNAVKRSMANHTSNIPIPVFNENAPDKQAEMDRIHPPSKYDLARRITPAQQEMLKRLDEQPRVYHETKGFEGVGDLKPPTTAPSAPYPQPQGTGTMNGSINDPHTYRKHTTGLKKSIGSNTYRLAKV
jgi:hypothetical protein